MRNRFYLCIFLPILLLSFESCTSGSELFTIIETTSELDYYSIEVYNDLLYLAGGDVWKQCDLSISENGKKWDTEYFTNRAIFDLHATSDRLLAVGTSGYLFSGDQEMQKIEINTYSLLRGISNIGERLIAVAGKDFNKGWIYSFDEDNNILAEHFYDHELSAIECDENGNCITSGYGIILSSSDVGITWTRSDQTGDFYNSISYNSVGIPFIVGYSGSIIYSEDLGTSWQSIKNGHSPLSNNKPFRSIKFYGNIGFIVGDNGTIWKSIDDGKSWSDISLNTELDLLDFVLFQNKLIIASESGKVISVPQ